MLRQSLGLPGFLTGSPGAREGRCGSGRAATPCSSCRAAARTRMRTRAAPAWRLQPPGRARPAWRAWCWRRAPRRRTPRTWPPRAAAGHRSRRAAENAGHSGRVGCAGSTACGPCCLLTSRLNRARGRRMLRARRAPSQERVCAAAGLHCQMYRPALQGQTQFYMAEVMRSRIGVG